MLLNEAEPVTRAGVRIYGIDDVHYFRVDNIEKAASDIPHQAFSILLSHTPEIYRQAAHAGFDLLLSGHTHGGHIRPELDVIFLPTCRAEVDIKLSQTISIGE
jgi:predicted MPP superfamily phosphohydrolase